MHLASLDTTKHCSPAGPVTGVLIVKGHVRILSVLGVLLTVAASLFCFVRFDFIGLLVFLPLA
ncbi:hypothetical protein V5799_018631, partial [Amblyomma americanum]